jgi:DedD protein
MARAAPTDEQLQLRRRARRRLIGAIALAIVVAVVLPWVLESEPRPSEEEVAIQIPSPEPGKTDPRSLPPGETSQKGSASAQEPGPERPAGETAPAQRDEVAPAPEKAGAEASAAPADGRPKPAGKSDAAAKQFVVQVAALADADKARDIQHELATRGLKAYTEKIKSSAGDVTRVRVGPFPSREAAEKERARLKSLGFEGNVTPR